MLYFLYISLRRRLLFLIDYRYVSVLRVLLRLRVIRLLILMLVCLYVSLFVLFLVLVVCCLSLGIVSRYYSKSNASSSITDGSHIGKHSRACIARVLWQTRASGTTKVAVS